MVEHKINHYRKIYYWSSLLNAASFNLIMGNLVMLFLAELQASDTSKGLVASLTWFSLLFLPLGKFFIRRIGVVKTLGTMWISRSVVVSSMALAVFLHGTGILSPQGAVLLIILAQIGFQVLRGIGMSANSPLFYHLTDQNNRSRFLSNLQVLSNIAAVVMLTFSSAMLRTTDSTRSYTLFYSLGAVLGVLTGLLYLQLQEPAVDHSSSRQPFSQAFASLWAERNSRRFLLVFALTSFVISAQGGFLIVFMRETSPYSDSSLLLYALGGPIGMVLLGLLLAPLLDRIGPKPFSQIYISFLLLVCVGAILSPLIPRTYLPYLYIGLFVCHTLGAAGGNSSLQAYFFNTMYRAQDINLGIILHFVQAAGGLGLIGGGILLDLLQNFSLSVTAKYEVFFVLSLLLLAGILFLSRGLQQSGDFGVKRTLRVLFSPREWYGLWLLTSLNRQPLSSREQSILPQIERSGARHIVASDYFRRLNSPSLLIREEALNGLRNMTLTASMRQQLIEHLEYSPFTTAAKAATLLGKQRVTEAIPTLRKGISSVDYNLQAEAALALARLGDCDSLPLLRSLLLSSGNQRAVIYTVNAIKILGSLADDLPVLLQLWQRWADTTQIDREVTLAVAALLGCEEHFFPHYFELCERNSPCWQQHWQNLPDHRIARQALDDPATRPTWLEDSPYVEQLSSSLWPALSQHSEYRLLAEHQNTSFWHRESGLFLLLFLATRTLRGPKLRRNHGRPTQSTNRSQ